MPKIGQSVLKHPPKVKKGKTSLTYYAPAIDFASLPIDKFQKVLKKMPRVKRSIVVAVKLFHDKNNKPFSLNELKAYADVLFNLKPLKSDCVRNIRYSKLITQKDNMFTPTKEALNLDVKVTEPKEVSMSFIGTSKIQYTIQAKKKQPTFKKDAIQRGLDANNRALLCASAAQIMGKNYALLDYVPVKQKFDIIVELDNLISSPLNDTTLVKMLDVQGKLEEFNPNIDFKKYPTPQVYIDKGISETITMYMALVDIGVALPHNKIKPKLNEAKQILLSNPSGKLYNLDAKAYSYLGMGFAGYGVINDIHQILIKEQKKVLKKQSIVLSKRVIADGALVKDSRVKMFASEWKRIKAENIISRTTGKTDAGVIFTKGKGRVLNAQIQVGDVNKHSIVLKDDGKVMQVQYNETGPIWRAEFAKDLFNAIELNAILVGKTVKATGKSRPENYKFLARIVPNLVDLDLGHGFSYGEHRKVALKAVLSGYAISTNRMRGASKKLKGVKASKLMTVIKKSSKLLGTEQYDDYLYSIKGKKVVSAVEKKKLKLAFPISSYHKGDIVYITAGKYGYPGMKGIVQKVQESMVYTKLPDGSIADKYPQNISFINPITGEISPNAPPSAKKKAEKLKISPSKLKKPVGVSKPINYLKDVTGLPLKVVKKVK